MAPVAAGRSASNQGAELEKRQGGVVGREWSRERENERELSDKKESERARKKKEFEAAMD